MNLHETYINRCITLAKNGLGNTYPNPLVGSVIVFENNIIGEGWHQKSGMPHAEVNAINTVKNKSLLCKSTIYVSLEPCSHFGKTPPCADLITKHKIPNIVIGTIDYNEKVAGKGVQKLLDTGANVITGILEKECLALNKRFFTFHTQKRPYIILKWAESKDKFIAPLVKNNPKPVWLSNEISRQLTHKWRTEEEAILVGKNTVLVDNPSLTARDWVGKNPIRIVLDPENSLSKDYQIFDSQARTIVVSNKTICFKTDIAQQICTYIYNQNIQSVIIEGGLQTLQTFIDANLWDEARVFRTNICLENGVKAPVIKQNSIMKIQNLKLINDNLEIIYNNDYYNNI